MMIPNYVKQYIDLYRNGDIIFNKERQQLIEHLERNVFSNEDLYFDNGQIESCITFIEKYFFPLKEFQKFLISFIFLFEKTTGDNYFTSFFWLVARGAGKNGLISALSAYFTGPLHNIREYHGTVVAMSEKQAMTSFEEFYNVVRAEGLENTANTPGYYNLMKSRITGLDTMSYFEYATSNPKTKDGGREGFLIFDEIHAYENNSIIEVFTGGLGKKPFSRTFYIGTDGFVREGVLDNMKKRAEAILNGKHPKDRMFPFMCKLDFIQEMDNKEMWSKANPMFEKPLTSYGRGLFREVEEKYEALEYNPSGREEFVTKRMNLPEVDLQKAVASDEEMAATNRPFPDLTGLPGVFGLDYASVRDFTAVGALFKDTDTGDYIWKTHSFAIKDYLDKAKLEPPIYEWVKDGLLTVVDKPTMDFDLVLDWLIDMREEFGINTIVCDNYKLEFIAPLLEAENFEVIRIRQPRAIHGLLAPRIEDMFANHKIIYGDNPLMRWYTWNVYVNIKKDGLKEYLKFDEHRRKNDGFQAMVHAMYLASDKLDVVEDDFILNDLI